MLSVRVVVLGSTGMVGRAVAARIDALPDMDLAAVSRATHDLDVGGNPDLRPLLRGAALAVNCIGLLRSAPSYPTAVFRHAATMINSLWPQKLAAQASDAGCRVLHLSSDAVFGPGSDPAGETTFVGPTEPYGLSKALGEVDADHVINLRISVMGPAPDRRPTLWEWLVRQPRGAVVPGYNSFGWAGCTSAQLAWFVSDIVIPECFEAIRFAGPAHHFVPNGTTTKFAVLKILAERLRPDVSVVPTPEPGPGNRPLVSSLGAWERAYTGRWGWQDALSP